MLTSSSCANDRHTDGFIVVAVLWIVAAVATLAVIYTVYVKETMVAFADHSERLQAQGLAMAGVEIAVYRLTAVPKVRPIQGRFSFRQGSAVVRVEFSSENARIDLNFAPKELLAGFFIGLGARSDAALSFADRIAAWRAPPGSPTDGAEAAIYQAAGKTYGPRHGPFQHVNELALLVDPPMPIDRVLPYLTVFSGRAEVNVLSAAPEVLAALPGITPERLNQLLTQRENMPEDVLRAQLGTAASYITLQPSAADRIDVDMRFRSNTRIHSQAVVFLLDNDVEPYRVLSWRDEGPASDERFNSGLL